MPNQGLVVGTSFSIGLGVGLFMSGANRLLVLLALAPAAAMAATLIAREGQINNGRGVSLRPLAAYLLDASGVSYVTRSLASAGVCLAGRRRRARVVVVVEWLVDESPRLPSTSST